MDQYDDRGYPVERMRRCEGYYDKDGNSFSYDVTQGCALYDKEGNYQGHIDPCGPRGEEGQTIEAR
jgi:hypothetical protein